MQLACRFTCSKDVIPRADHSHAGRRGRALRQANWIRAGACSRRLARVDSSAGRSDLAGLGETHCCLGDPFRRLGLFTGDGHLKVPLRGKNADLSARDQQRIYVGGSCGLLVAQQTPLEPGSRPAGLCRDVNSCTSTAVGVGFVVRNSDSSRCTVWKATAPPRVAAQRSCFRTFFVKVCVQCPWLPSYSMISRTSRALVSAAMPDASTSFANAAPAGVVGRVAFAGAAAFAALA